MYNALLILVAAAIHFGIGALWYSKLFKELWIRTYGLSQIENNPTPMHMAQAGGVALMASLGLCYLTNGFSANTLLSGISVGFFSWLFLIVSSQYSSVIWNKRPLQGYFIDVGFWLTSFVILGGFFGMFH